MIKIEPATLDEELEEQRERAYHAEVDDYLLFMMREQVKKMDSARGMNESIAQAIQESNFERSSVDGRYFFTFDQKRVGANHLISTRDRILKESEQKRQHYFSIRKEPYFGRVDFGKNPQSLRRCYIGETKIDGYVYDWREKEVMDAFVNAAELNHSGKAYVELKRNVKIQNGSFIYSYDELNLASSKLQKKIQKIQDAIEKTEAADKHQIEIQTSDTYLQQLLEEYRELQEVHTIIRSIQQNQYALVTVEPEKNILLEGCAGSGKTMVMYHRLSHLFYNYPDRIRPEWVYSITPSALFTEGMNTLLEQLHLGSMRNQTYRDTVEQLIAQYTSPREIINPYAFFSYASNSNASKFTALSTTKIQTAIKNVNIKEFRSWLFSILQRQLVEAGLTDFSSCNLTWNAFSKCIRVNYYNELFLKKDAVARYHHLSNDFYGREYFRNYPFSAVLSYVTKQYTTGGNKKRYSILNRNYRLLKDSFRVSSTQQDIESVADFTYLFDNEKALVALATLIHADNMMKHMDVFYDYKEFMKPERRVPFLLYFFYYATRIQNPELNVFADEDMERAAILNLLAQEFNPLEKGKTYFFIDEFQNYSSLEIQALKAVFPNAVFNFYGDFSQRLNAKGISNPNELAGIGSLQQFEIKENYRNAIEITEYINKKHGMDMRPVGLHGTVSQVPANQCDFSLSGRTVLIAKGQEEIQRIVALIGKKSGIHVVSGHETILSKDVLNVMTVAQAKGLEFETVYVDESNMTENEKYVACTRALNALVIVEPEKAADPVNKEFQGAYTGTLKLVPFLGKLKKHTKAQTVQAVIPLPKKKKGVRLSVQFDSKNQIVYIPQRIYAVHVEALNTTPVLTILEIQKNT